MDTYTRAYMAATMPSCDSLSSIGSVAANWSRTSTDEQDADFVRYSNNSVLAESILATQGIVAYEAYIAEIQARAASDRLTAGKKAAKMEARAITRTHQRARILDFLSRIRQLAHRHS